MKEKEKVKEKEKISKQKKQVDKPPVQLKKAEKSKKNGVNTANGSVPPPEKKKGIGDLTVDELLKLDGLHKWQYVINMASNEDCEALEILLCERREAIAAELEKEIKKEKQDPIMIKEEKQTDSSCDRTTCSSSEAATEKQATDATDVTDSDTSSDIKQKKCRRKLNREFVMFVGDEKRRIKILEVESDESSQKEEGTDSGTESSYQQLLKEVVSECTDSKAKE